MKYLRVLDPAPSEAFVLCLLKSDLELLCLSPSSIPACKTNRNANCQEEKYIPSSPITKNNLKKKSNKIERVEFLFLIYFEFEKFCHFRMKQIYKFDSNNRKIGEDWKKKIFFFFLLLIRTKQFRWNNLEILMNMLENSRFRSSLLFKQTAIRNYKLSGIRETIVSNSPRSKTLYWQTRTNLEFAINFVQL